MDLDGFEPDTKEEVRGGFAQEECLKVAGVSVGIRLYHLLGLNHCFHIINTGYYCML